MENNIVIKGARHNNLKNITVTIPRNKLVVVTGVSGSGKSSLVFDTIFMEGRRRLLDCFSPFERHYLGNIRDSEVDSIEGLSTVVAVEQKKGTPNSRSTVGTITSVYDYMRLLFSRAGDAKCPFCSSITAVYTKKQIIDCLCSLPEMTEVDISALVYKDPCEACDSHESYTQVHISSIVISKKTLARQFILLL